MRDQGPSRLLRVSRFLEHPITRTVLVVAEISALLATAFSLFATMVEMQERQVFSAYELIASPVVPPAGKWNALRLLLPRDRNFAHFDTNCARLDGFPLWGFEQPCGGTVRDMPLDGTINAEDGEGYLLLTDFRANQTIFETKGWNRVQFIGGSFANSYFDRPTGPVYFRAFDLSGSSFSLAPYRGWDIYAQPADEKGSQVQIDMSDLTESRVSVAAPGEFEVYHSNITNVLFFTPLFFEIDVLNNYYVADSPPQWNGEPAPELAEWECVVALPPGTLPEEREGTLCTRLPQDQDS